MLRQPEFRPRQYLHSLDILRSIAILLVMCWHLPKEVKLAIAPISQNGLWGVDLFFVLSGFLIANQLFSHLIRDGGVDFRSFYIRRVLRTWPCYFAVLVLYLMFPAFWEHSDMPPLWKFLTFTQNFNLKFSAFSHAWSLCIEEQFYLLFPCVAVLLWRLKNARFVLSVIVSLFLLGILIRVLMWFTFVDGLPNDFDRQYFSKIYYPTWSRLDGLVLGVSIAALKNFTSVLWQRITARGNWLLVSGILILIMGFWLQSDRYSLLAAALGFPVVSMGFGAIVLSALSPSSLLNRLKVPGTGIIAMLSFSLYLLHKQVFHLTSDWLKSFEVQNLFASVALMFLVSLLSAAVLHLIVERPFLTVRDKLTNQP